jgi:hypothetical protein
MLASTAMEVDGGRCIQERTVAPLWHTLFKRNSRAASTEQVLSTLPLIRFKIRPAGTVPD